MYDQIWASTTFHVTAGGKRQNFSKIFTTHSPPILPDGYFQDLQIGVPGGLKFGHQNAVNVDGNGVRRRQLRRPEVY